MTEKHLPRVAVLIVGAGQGSRASSYTNGTPKQFFPVLGRTVFQRTIDAFSSAAQIAHIACVVPENMTLEQNLEANLNSEEFPLSFVNGGESRQLSVLYGLKHLEALSKDWDIVLIHDAARPFISKDLILSVIALALDHGGCVAAIPVVDSLKQTEHGTNRDKDVICISGSIRRDGIYQAQTPQGFDFKDILAAHARALDDGHRDYSDDSVIYEKYCGSVVIATGDRNNWKITEPEDFDTAALLIGAQQELALMPDVRVGHGYDVHAFEPGAELTLCGITLPHERGLKGHSDADVGLHALTDAVLGALADGDIGSHFPPSDPKWKAASSDQFLAYSVALARGKGITITHLDVTLVCEAPKIGPHRDAMRGRIAQITDLDQSRISVKATTSERLGFTGRKEGISAFATATLVFQGHNS